MNGSNRIVNIKEYGSFLITHIVAIIISIVVGVILLLGVCIIKNGNLIKNSSSDQKIIEEQADALYSSLSFSDQISVNVAINDFEDYYHSYVLLNDSIIEKVDSYNARKLSLMYTVNYIGADKLSGEDLANIINQYSMIIYYYENNGSLARAVSDKLGIETNYIQDCISANGYSNNTGVLNLDIWGTEINEGLEEAVISSMEDYIFQITNDTDIKITLISNNTSYTRQAWIFENQKNWEAEQDRIKTRLDTAVAGLSTDAYECFKLTASTEYPEFYEAVYPDTVSNNNSITPKTLVKYSVVGAAIGFALYAVYAIFVFMYSKKVVSITDYSYTMGLKMLGSVTAAMKNDDMSIAATKIFAACDKLKITEIALISTNEECTKEYIDLLSRKLEESGLKPICITSFMCDYKEMGTLLKIGNCVIVEKMNSSLFSNVYDEVALCNENSVNILGLVNIAK